MKKSYKFLMSFILLLLSVSIMAQAPKKFNYQAVVRDNSGTVISNQAISLRISIHETTASGSIVYQEIHSAATNQYGLVTIQIGGGTPSNGSDFTAINWGTKAKYIQVEIDTQGGTNYTDMGSSELLSVPYALYADEIGNSTKETVPSGILGQTLRHDGTQWIANSFLYNNGTNIGINTTSPSALFQVTNGSVAFTGSTGSTPISGAGRRMMWVPDKGAFRAGYVTGTFWNADSIGSYSVAIGRDTKAKGAYGVAMGFQTTAGNSGTVAFGSGATASGLYSVAAGYNTVAKGAYSFASGSTTNAGGNFSVGLGYYTNANGMASVSMGYRTYAKSYASVAFGRYNVVEGDSLNWVATDPLFALGNGVSAASPANAFTVYKNGNTTVSGQLTIKGGTPGAGKVLISDASGLASWSSTNAILPSGSLGQTLRYNGTKWTASKNLYNDSLRVGIGTTSPNIHSKLHVVSKNKYGAYVTSDSLGSGNHIIHAEYNGISGTADVVAVYGRSNPHDYYGFGGMFEGGFIGVEGKVSPVGNGEYIGTHGYVSGGNGDNFGLYGEAYGIGINYGIYTIANGGINNWAAYFDGRVYSDDSLTIGEFTIPNIDGASGQVLKTNGSGKLFWANDINTGAPTGITGTVQFNNSGSFKGDSSLFWNNSTKMLGVGTIIPTNKIDVNGDINVARNKSYKIYGISVLKWDDIRNNILVGPQTGPLVTGSANTFIGAYAGTSTIGGYFNSFLGFSSGKQNTSGYANTFLGYNSGYSNTKGNSNTFIGCNAGFNSDTAWSNTFIGTSCGLNNANGVYNTFLGAFAGRDNTTSNNTFLGANSGTINTTGTNNTFVGANSGENNLIGHWNTFIGQNSGSQNFNGNFNTFVGHLSGAYNYSGISNVMVGDNAGFNNYSGSENIFIGKDAGHSVYNTSYNTFIGDSSGYFNTGLRNVFLGHNSGMNETGSDKLYIDNTSTSTPLIYGDFSKNTVTINETLVLKPLSAPPANPVEGQMYYDNIFHKLRVYDGTAWQNCW